MKGKKLLAVMLAALMSASSVGVTAFADEVQTTGISTLAAGDPVSTTVAAIGEDSYATLAEAMASLASRTGDIVIKLSGTASYEYNAWADFTKGYEGGTITFEGADETKATVLNLHGKDTDATPIQNAKKLIFKNLTINKTNAGDEGSAPWNRHSINFLGEVEFENVAVNTTVAVSGDASFTKVDFTETNEQYCLFVLNSAKNVTVKDCTFTATNNGRGIKIADQYVDEANQNSVNLTVTGSKFTTAKKAAVLVTVNKGANIVVGDNDITGVAADSTYIVWVDEDRAANASKVVVKNSNGSISSSVKVENGDGVTYEALAEINGVKYISLKDAVENATNGQTVKILKDIEIDSLEHKDIVLNHNIKSDVYAKINADVTIDFNNHSLKFSDKFKQNADAGKSHVMFFIESGNVTVTGNGNVNAYVNGNTKSRVFHCGYGITLNIENGDFRACEYVLYNVGYTSRIYIKGGTLGFPEECTGNHHRFDYKGIVCCLHDYDNIFVTDGTFIGVDPRDNGSTVIDSSKYAVSRFGNKYKVIPASSVVATITDVNKKQNNVYSYKSLQDAYNGAENEDTIVLTKDIVLTKADIEADNRLVRATRTKEDLSKVTFDFDGHTISLAEDVKNATCEDYRVFNVWYSDFTLKNGTIDLTNAAGSNAFIAAVRAYNEAYVRFDINIIINPKPIQSAYNEFKSRNVGTHTYQLLFYKNAVQATTLF